MMEIKQVQYFLAVVESGSYNAAAEELYISQSSLSKQIMALEKELQLKLFDRSRRKVSLTEAGEMFLKHAMQLNKDHEAMLAEISGYRKKSPSLAIASIPVAAQYGITSYIARFKKAHPQINFILEERQASSVLAALGRRRYDLAFLRDYNLDSGVFEWIPVMTDRLTVALSCEHPFAKRKSISLGELAGENFIMFGRGTLIHDLSMNACRQAGFEPKVFYATLRAASIIGMVASNSGVALMMEKVLNYYNNTAVVAVPLEQKYESRIVLAHLRDRKLSAPARTFVDFMKNQVAGPELPVHSKLS